MTSPGPIWPGSLLPTASRVWVSRQWNILAGGPSVWDTPRYALLPGPTIALNRSILLAKRLPVDIWAVWDDLHRLGIPLSDIKPILPTVEVWGSPKRRHELEDLGVQWWQELPSGALWDGIKQELCLAQCLYLALDHAHTLGGTHFRCFGVDLQGTWRFNRAMGRWGADASPEEEARWLHERAYFAQCQAKARSHGMILERWPSDLAA
jgi:hypothetical protein